MSATAGTDTGTVPITVAVPTYRRPDALRVALPLLLGHARELRGRHPVEVLVVDNDPQGSAAPIVAELGDPGLRYVAEPTPGIAAVRNRAIAEAGRSRLLAFIDDDERPQPGWLASLVTTWEASGAAAVSGRVLSEFAGDLDPWIAAGDFWSRPRLATGTPIDVAATGNLLLDLDQVRCLGVRFSTELGLGGGEDTLFSRALVRAGGCIVWCDESVAVDVVPVQRMTRSWLVTRWWSHGNTTVLTDLRLAGSAGARLAVRARGVVRGVLRIAGGAARWVLGGLIRSDRHQSRGLRAVCRGIAMVGAACGVVFHEYARDGRRWRLSWGGVR